MPRFALHVCQSDAAGTCPLCPLTLAAIHAASKAPTAQVLYPFALPRESRRIMFAIHNAALKTARAVKRAALAEQVASKAARVVADKAAKVAAKVERAIEENVRAAEGAARRASHARQKAAKARKARNVEAVKSASQERAYTVTLTWGFLNGRRVATLAVVKAATKGDTPREAKAARSQRNSAAKRIGKTAEGIAPALRYVDAKRLAATLRDRLPQAPKVSRVVG